MDCTGLPYIVEPMQLSDVPTVAAIEEAVFPLPWSASSFTYELRSNPYSHYLVARLRHQPTPDRLTRFREVLHRLTGSQELDWRIAGYGGFWLVMDEAHISTLAVRPDLRRRGIGELLLVSLIDWAIELHAAVVTLEVRVSNLAAQALYEKYGLVKVGRRKAYYSDNREDALIMTSGLLTSASFQAQFQRLKDALREKLLQQNLRKDVISDA